jgi:hydroxymethylbilane synthase
VIRIGTRGSALAMAQARIVAELLGDERTKLVVVRTAGDRSDKPIRDLGDGAFVARLEAVLLRGEVDLAVHSLKDVPTAETPGCTIAAIPAREDPRDVLVTAARGGLRSLPEGARVGTSSPRRAAFLLAVRPDLRFTDIRGNVETRLRKVRDGEVDATILALAGLRRLGIPVASEEILPIEVLLPAPGQGALAVQCRADDLPMRDRLASIDDRAVRAAVTAERALLHRLGASCDLALGALGAFDGSTVTLHAALALDGERARVTTSAADPQEAARLAAEALRPVSYAL